MALFGTFQPILELFVFSEIMLQLMMQQSPAKYNVATAVTLSVSGRIRQDW